MKLTPKDQNVVCLPEAHRIERITELFNRVVFRMRVRWEKNSPSIVVMSAEVTSEVDLIPNPHFHFSTPPARRIHFSCSDKQNNLSDLRKTDMELRPER